MAGGIHCGTAGLPQRANMVPTLAPSHRSNAIIQPKNARALLRKVAVQIAKATATSGSTSTRRGIQ